ncbi:MAG: hypothetical protein ACTSWA_12640 [Candidatus Thorarchaeota archaeon]
MSGFRKSMAYPWALTGIFGAVHLIITLIPFNISVGGGGEISFGLVSAPIIGFLLGPFFGVIAVFIGSFLAIFINPLVAILGPFTIIATAAGAFAAGAMRTKIRIIIPIAFLLSMAIYLISPIGVLVPAFIWFHFIAFLISLIFIIPQTSARLVDALNLNINTDRWFMFGIIWLFCLVAVTLDQAVGSAIGGWYFVLLGADAAFMAGFFEVAIILYAFERIVGSILVAIIIFALANVLSRADYGLPLSRIGKHELLELDEHEI